MIKIKTKKCIRQGVKHRKILNIVALSKERLPIVYLADEFKEGAIWKHEYWKHEYADSVNLMERNGFGSSYGDEFGDFGPLLSVGQVVEEKKFQAIIEFIHKCGKRLSKINAQLRKENAGWEGIEEICI